MADIKTNIRELSVAIGINLISQNKNINIDKLCNPKIFINTAKDSVSNLSYHANNILDLNKIEEDNKQILINGFTLANKIVKDFKITQKPNIIWCGFNNKKDNPTDIIVNNLCFSLKTDSFILENMGLYKLLTCITTHKFRRGVHIFREFALQEYENWFNYTWNFLCNNQEKWIYTNTQKGYVSSISFEKENVILNYNNKVISKIPFSTTNEMFIKNTRKETREKVFAKWINDVLSKDTEYIKLKKICSETAGKNISQLITSTIDVSQIEKLFQIKDNEYYYAKVTNKETTILKVPDSQNFNKKIIMKPITYSVPESQLNLEIPIENINTKQYIVIRIECRFSHGQFNGTPEAKVYYSNGGDLSIIYEKI